MLRRLKTQVLSDLPEKLESVVYAPMTGEQLKLYSAHEQRLREELTRQKNDKAATIKITRKVMTAKVVVSVFSVPALSGINFLLASNPAMAT